MGSPSRSIAPRGFSCYYGCGSREDTRRLLLWARIGGPLGQPGWHHQALRRHDETGVCISSTTVLSMKLMPITMIPTGTTSVHQNSSEFLLNIELSKPVFIFIVLLPFDSRYVSGELVEGM